MKIISKTFKVLTVFLLILGVTGCSDDDNDTNPVPLVNIVDTVIADAELTSLVAALQRADLVDLLRNGSDWTVLAPTNEAFSDYLGTTALEDVPVPTLRNLLLNHVISARVPSVNITSSGSGYAKTNAAGPNNEFLSIYYEFDTDPTDGGVFFNGESLVERADIFGTNGIIHVVDEVIELPTIVTFATADSEFSSLIASLTTAGQPDFVTILSTPDGTTPAPFTVFAPNNAAFTALLNNNDNWDSPADIDSGLLTAVLQHHVLIDDNVQSGGLTPNGTTSPETLQGQTIDITLPGTNGNIADVTDGAGSSDIGIIVVNLQAANGVIHVINKVMLPSLD